MRKCVTDHTLTGIISILEFVKRADVIQCSNKVDQDIECLVFNSDTSKE